MTTSYPVKHDWVLANNLLTIIKIYIYNNVRECGYIEEKQRVLEAYILPNPNLGEANDKGKTIIDDFGTSEIFIFKTSV